MFYRTVAAAALLALLSQVGIASASPISIYNNNPLSLLPSATLRANIECGGECEAASFNQAGTATIGFSSLFGEAVGGPGSSSAAAQTTFVSTALASSFATGTKTSPASGGISYAISAAYVLLHFGEGNAHMGYALLKNTSLDGIFSFIYNKAPGSNGGGLSNFTAIGTYTPPVNSVPLPAAGFMLLAAVGGLGAFKRRHRKAVGAAREG